VPCKSQVGAVCVLARCSACAGLLCSGWMRALEQRLGGGWAGELFCMLSLLWARAVGARGRRADAAAVAPLPL